MKIVHNHTSMGAKSEDYMALWFHLSCGISHFLVICWGQLDVFWSHDADILRYARPEASYEHPCSGRVSTLRWVVSRYAP